MGQTDDGSHVGRVDEVVDVDAAAHAVTLAPTTDSSQDILGVALLYNCSHI